MSTAPDFDSGRMTVGEHLDELRARVVRSLVALVVACVLLIYPAQYIFWILVRPVILTLRQHGQPENLLQTSPTELMTIYIKVVLIAGVVVASPYILYQIWQFIAAGLYPRERRWVMRLFPFSAILFVTGVFFMYTIALLVSLNFLVGFSNWIPLPKPQPTMFERGILGIRGADPADEGGPPLEELTEVPRRREDPIDPPIGVIWYNTVEHKLKFRAADQVYAVQMLAEKNRPLTTTYFKIGEYLSFVLTMTLAFGIAFQMPLVVLALVRSGVMTVQQVAKSRKYFILGILVVAGVLAPPEVVSHLTLAIPMVLLFELGLMLARRQRRPER
jgi:Sec-independent protein secretion pathway component TatC